MSFLRNVLVDEGGQDLVEYGLVVAGIAVVGAAAFALYTGALTTGWTAVTTAVSNAL
jgi:Flp pilus assembly pilin Flp